MTVKGIFARNNNVGQALNASSLAAQTSNTANAPSPQIWFDFPEGALKDGVDWQGVSFWDDWTSMPKTPATTEGNFGSYSQFAGATGAITAWANTTYGGGGPALTSTASADGVSIRAHSSQVRIDRSVGSMWFEARVLTTSITDGLQQMLVGLIEDVAQTSAVPIASTSAISSNNFIGFFQQGTGAGYGAAMDTIYRSAGNATQTVQAKGVTLAANTWTKLGIRYQPYVDPLIQDPNFQNLGKYNVTFYQDGVRLASYVQVPVAQGNPFPNSVMLSPVFTFMSRNSTPGSIVLDWWKCGQVTSPGFTGF